MPLKALTHRQRQVAPRDDRPSASVRGYDHAWAKLSNHHRTRVEPLCRVCAGAGEMVHHVEPVDVAPHRRLDPTNLATLCNRCHAMAHAGAIEVPPNVGVMQ
jgi:5-methylcytosine-specific restriction endonuclease McrA